MTPYELHVGDCRDVLATLPEQSVQTCVTSPPYFGLRDYGHEAQIGLEPTPEEFVTSLVDVFRGVRRVLRDDGTVWLNLGDSYSMSTRGAGGNGKQHTNAGSVMGDRSWSIAPGLKPKDLIGIPWRVAFALQADGWYLRSDIIWHKPNPMPESIRDRPTKSHEYIFLLSKNERYYYDHEAIAEEAVGGTTGGFGNAYDAARKLAGSGGKPTDVRGMSWATRNKRSVWTVPTAPYPEAHFATYPPELIRPCILAGSPPAGKRCDCDSAILTPTGNGTVDDPTMTTGRAGMNRPRRDGEGSRPITRGEQRHHAGEMRASPHRAAMEALAGPAFAHYIRTDLSGARPLPESLRALFTTRGWITIPPTCACPVEPAGTVLDPFNGAGTTGLVALQHQRRYIGIELNPEYARLTRARLDPIANQPGLFGAVA